MCQLFAEQLQLDQVGIEDNFFTLGGNSITAIRVIAAAKLQRLAFSVSDMFAHPHDWCIGHPDQPTGAAKRLSSV